MDVSLKKISKGSRPILENIFQYYIYEMSEFLPVNLEAVGRFSYNAESLDPYWDNKQHIPYFVYVHEQLAGFVLVRKYPEQKEFFDIDQFFIVRKYQSRGVGQKVFKQVMNKHSGLWQVRVLKENESALGFWKKVISNLVGSKVDFVERVDEDIAMYFFRFDAPGG